MKNGLFPFGWESLSHIPQSADSEKEKSLTIEKVFQHCHLYALFSITCLLLTCGFQRDWNFLSKSVRIRKDSGSPLVSARRFSSSFRSLWRLEENWASEHFNCFYFVFCVSAKLPTIYVFVSCINDFIKTSQRQCFSKINDVILTE